MLFCLGRSPSDGCPVRLQATPTRGVNGFVVEVAGVAWNRCLPGNRVVSWRGSDAAPPVTAVVEGRFNGSPCHGVLRANLLNRLGCCRATKPRIVGNQIGALDAILGRARADSVGVGVAFIPTWFQYDLRRRDDKHLWVRGGTVVGNAWRDHLTQV